MTALPRVGGRELIKALGRCGFEVIRIKGSHHVLRHADGRITVIPAHGSETIDPGLPAKILRDCDVTPEALEIFLKR